MELLSKTNQASVLIPWFLPSLRLLQRRPGAATWASGCVSPAENRAHLLIRHALLLGHTDGPAQINGQDVFALEEKSTDVTPGGTTLRVARTAR